MTNSIHGASTSSATRHTEAHTDAASIFKDLSENAQRDVMARVIDEPIRDRRLDALRGALFANKTLHARLTEAIADRLRTPTDEQRNAHNDRELGFAQSRAQFEKLKQPGSGDFRTGLRKLLEAHRHVEISFVQQAFPVEKDVFGADVPAWPARRALVEPSSTQRLQRLRRSRVDSQGMREHNVANDRYYPTLAEHREIVIEELAKTTDLANLRWNASCPEDFKDRVLQLLDDFALRENPSARPRIELAIHGRCKGNTPNELWNDASIDNDDLQRLAANPLVERLDLVAVRRTGDASVLNLLDAVSRSSITALRLNGYELRSKPSAALEPHERATDSKLESLSVEWCGLGTREECEDLMSEIAQCPRLKTLSFGNSTLGDTRSACTTNVLTHLRTHAARLETLSVQGWGLTLNALNDAMFEEALGIRSLKSLRVPNNRVLLAAASPALAEHPSLEEIDLSCNPIGREAALLLVDVERLKRLNLKSSSIAFEDADALFRDVAKDIRV